MDPSTTEDHGGKSGQWFLEAVGKAVEAPPPATILEPATEESAGSDVADDVATEEAASVPADSTSELVGQMWRATGTQDPLENWEPADLDRHVSRKRNFRWTVWIMAFLVIGAVTAAALLSPQLVERQAASEASDYSAALADLRSNLPATQQVLRALTEPDTPVGELSNLVPDLSRLQAASDAVIAAATRPLPEPLPFIPSGALDDLQPSRDTMARLGADASAIADQLGDGISYRSLVAAFLDVGELPAAAETLDISSIQERLATALADATGTLAQLPGNDVFAEHRAALTDAVEIYTAWETNYIAALRAQDDAVALQLIAQHEDLLTSLDTALVPALAALRSQIDERILTLDRELVDAIEELPN
ncbi:MAG: hypothetical protein QNJ88_07750 [Acidimicrobiia bacterium]|nr:hypothetical protein [Acidimicrobiia bacterium]